MYALPSRPFASCPCRLNWTPQRTGAHWAAAARAGYVHLLLQPATCHCASHVPLPAHWQHNVSSQGCSTLFCPPSHAPPARLSRPVGRPPSGVARSPASRGGEPPPPLPPYKGRQAARGELPRFLCGGVGREAPPAGLSGRGTLQRGAPPPLCHTHTPPRPGGGHHPAGACVGFNPTSCGQGGWESCRLGCGGVAQGGTLLVSREGRARSIPPTPAGPTTARTTIK